MLTVLLPFSFDFILLRLLKSTVERSAPEGFYYPSVERVRVWRRLLYFSLPGAILLFRNVA